MRELEDVPIPTFVVDHAGEAARLVAAEVGALVARRPDCVLGLATGRTPVATYAELVKLHRAGLDFSKVRTFNLDEYDGLDARNTAGFRAFMRKQLFEPAGFDLARTHFPVKRTTLEDAALACARFELDIAECGGIDLQLLGIGRNGHIAFNEPDSVRSSRTRRVALAEPTRVANASDFPEATSVPHYALTMGIGTILEARRLFVMAFGANKADILFRTLREPIGPDVPASFLREHENVALWLDEAAAARL